MWEELINLGVGVSVPWCVCGDLNEVLYAFEKRGLPKSVQRMELFRSVVQDCNLSNLGFSRAWYTWVRGNFANNNIREWLDDGSANES